MIGKHNSRDMRIDYDQQIACFSYDHDHMYHSDGRSLRYYYPPRIGADLSKGFGTFRQADDTVDEHLDSLLKRIITLEKETGQPCEADIITWRGMMTKVLDVPVNACFLIHNTDHVCTI
jgi:RAT1-interacting protein